MNKEDGFLNFESLRTTGMLWLINKVVFHPRGFALGFVYEDGELLGWNIEGNGSEPWHFPSDVDDQYFEIVEGILETFKKRPNKD